MKNSYKVVFEPSRPNRSMRQDNVSLKRQWALVSVGRVYGYAVISRFATKEAAEAALKKLTNG
jgi:hypothetical protein